MIDLHLHTIASDGTLTPAALVARAEHLGVRTLSVTDHDTMAGVPDAAAAASRLGLEFLPGIEITAVLEGRDVHILAYFLDATPPGLDAFLQRQQTARSDRARRIAARLAELGMPIDVERIISDAHSTHRSVTRPLLARALTQAGHADSEPEAFARWLGDGRAAYVPREGASPADVVRLVSRAGGVSALAHPGLLKRDELIPSLAKTGLAALEVYHSEHDSGVRAHYTKLARQHGLASSGGSDYHGESHHRAKSLGVVGLPREEFMPLLQKLLLAHSVVHQA